MGCLDMGAAPSASVYWGFDLGMTDYETWDSLIPGWMDQDEERDWEEELATRLGWQEVPFPAGGPELSTYYRQFGYDIGEREYKKAEAAFRDTPEYEAWSASRSRMHSLVMGYPVALVTYSNGDDPGYCVKIKASEQHPPDWGDIELKPLIVGDDWEAQIMDFMKLMELPIPKGEKPAWHVNCSYG